MSIARKILENTFVQVLGKLITALLSIFVLKIITRYLGTSGYGDYTTIYQYLAFFGIIADFGILGLSEIFVAPLLAKNSSASSL